ncbi:MAG: thiamine phosphate synthase [Planctomycetota bacterium]
MTEPALEPWRLRALDAGANRAREAARVVEDWVRFALDRADLSDRFRRIRHRVSEILPAGLSLALARDSAGDVGIQALPPASADRSSGQGIARANLKRLEEALRSIEEHAGILPAARVAAAALRTEAYEAESAVERAMSPKGLLAGVRLYVLVTERLSRVPPEEAAEAAIRGGAGMIQMREKELEDGEFLARARRMRAQASRLGALFIVNDRVDACLLAGADGVHLGLGDLPVREARRILGPEKIVGVSTREPAQAMKAMDDGADYVGVGPVHPTPTKEHRASVGLEVVREASAKIPIPWFAIGDVNETTLRAIRDAGARRVAACRAVIAAPDAEAAARTLLEILGPAAPPERPTR